MSDINKKIDTRSGIKKVADGLDFFFNKLLPKKVIVVTVATVLVFKEVNVPQEYWYILMAYFGVNVVGKFASVIGSKTTTDSDIAG